MSQNKNLTIGCLGWGSLVWDPRDLSIRGTWFDDGPLLPIEFVRESSGNRITLVICELSHRVRSLWTLLEADNLDTAKNNLAQREGIKNKNKDIGFWEAVSDKTNGYYSGEIGEWARAKSLDAVVWTNLEVGFRNNRKTLPLEDEIIDYLRDKLSRAEAKQAEEYIRKAPPQIDTKYRRRIEKEFKWYHVK